MCKNCECENQHQCSIHGYQPSGWCCELCIHFDPEIICKDRFALLLDTQRMEGYCLGCEAEKYHLTWIYLNSHKGFCRECLAKNDKMTLLNIALEKCEQKVK